jgi:3-hydroxyisobutyrate dehydrogenase
MEIGYIGLGTMGGALASRLQETYPLTIYDLNTEAVARLKTMGATAANSLKELAKRCDIIMICVPRSDDVHKIIFEDKGLYEGLSAGKIIVDQTSGDPPLTRKMAAKLQTIGVEMIDAPVSGGAKGAAEGTIAVMMGGEDEVIAQIKPIFESISPNIYHCGAIGSGQVLKLINNTISTCNRFALLEGVALGIKNGLSIDKMSEVLNSGGARSKSSEMLLPALARGEHSAIFALNLMLKDLNLAAELAQESAVPHQFGQLARGMLQMAANAFGPEANIDDIADLVAQQAGISFKPE